MKFFILITVFFTSHYAFACPQFDGEYVSQITNFSVEREKSGNFYVYHFDGGFKGPVLVDSMEHETESFGEPGVYYASCIQDRDTLVINFRSESQDETGETRYRTIDVNFKKLSNKQVHLFMRKATRVGLEHEGEERGTIATKK